MPNRLATENSPYLLQHAENPVDWYPWSEEALEKARVEDKPIFLSVGYAGLTLALLALYQTDPDPRWYNTAMLLAAEMDEHFTDPDGGFFDTRDDHESLLLRPKNIQDNATPSGNALAALALLQLATYGDRIGWGGQAEEMILAVQDAMRRYPAAFAQWLCAADFALGPTYEVAIIGDAPNQELTSALWGRYRPRLVAAIALHPPPDNAPALLQERPLRNNLPTAYVCQGFVCQVPVNSPGALQSQLGDKTT